MSRHDAIAKYNEKEKKKRQELGILKRKMKPAVKKIAKSIVKYGGVYENMGVIEIRELEDLAGRIGYDYYDTCIIQEDIQKEISAEMDNMHNYISMYRDTYKLKDLMDMYIRSLEYTKYLEDTTTKMRNYR